MTDEFDGQPGYDQAMILRIGAVATVFADVAELDDPAGLDGWAERVVQPYSPLGWRIINSYGDCIFDGYWPDHIGSFD